MGGGTQHECGDTGMFLQHDFYNINSLARLNRNIRANAHFVEDRTGCCGHKLLRPVACFCLHRRLNTAPCDKVSLLNERQNMHCAPSFGGAARCKAQGKPCFLGFVDNHQICPHIFPRRLLHPQHFMNLHSLREI